MKIKWKPETYTIKGNIENKIIFDETVAEYDGLISKLHADCNAWRFVGLVCLLMLCASLGILIYTLKLPKTELVVVGVNDIGEARYYGKTRGISYDDYDMKGAAIKNILTTYIENTYTITTDSQYMYNNYVKAMNYLAESKRRFYELDIKNEDPFSMVGLVKRNPEIETIIPVSESTYQVDFYIVESDMDGYGKRRTKKRGIFTLFKLSAKDYNNLEEKRKVLNPLGIYITDYNIVDVE